MKSLIIKLSASIGLAMTLTLGLLTSCSDSSVDPIPPSIGDSDYVLFINEINAGGDPTDWIEIYNPGSELVSLEGFYLYDDNTDKYQIPSGIEVPPRGFILFFCDRLVTGTHTNFKLSNNGELVVLEDPSQVVVDFVEYPRIRSGQYYSKFPDGSASMLISGVSTPKSSNGQNPGPALQKLNRDPAVPTQDQPVAVTVEAFHQQGQITEVQLFHRFNGGSFSSATMALLISDSIYSGTIPSSNMDATVDYYVSATDQNGLTTYKPNGAPDNLRSYIISSTNLPELVINEFLAANDACCPDIDGEIEEFDDWIEIFNAGPDPIDIGGYHLSDDPSDPFKHKITDDEPSITTIQPGEFLLIWADGDTDQGPFHTPFRLSAAGESVGLYYFDGRTIDSYQYDAQEADVSMGRSPDGSANWMKFTSPTPGVSN